MPEANYIRKADSTYLKWPQEQLIHTPRTLELVTRTRGALSESRGWIRTSTQKLFGHDWNPRFAANAET